MLVNPKTKIRLLLSKVIKFNYVNKLGILNLK